MIYADTSIVLATLLREPRRPPASFATSPLVSSRLLAYEVWVRVNAYRPSGLAKRHVAAALEAIDLADLSEEVLERALRPFPVPVRTLDAIHLATADYLARHGGALQVATYDRRLAAAAAGMGMTLAPTSVTG